MVPLEPPNPAAASDCKQRRLWGSERCVRQKNITRQRGNGGMEPIAAQKDASRRATWRLRVQGMPTLPGSNSPNLDTENYAHPTQLMIHLHHSCIPQPS
eukprot:scaffold122855_cov31-Tisochrysis_lutea.AAC.2